MIYRKRCLMLEWTATCRDSLLLEALVKTLLMSKLLKEIFMWTLLCNGCTQKLMVLCWSNTWHVNFMRLKFWNMWTTSLSFESQEVKRRSASPLEQSRQWRWTFVSLSTLCPRQPLSKSFKPLLVSPSKAQLTRSSLCLMAMEFPSK